MDITFALSRFLGLAFIAVIIIIVVAAILYRMLYQRRINKQLHEESPRPLKLLSPLAFTIVTVFIMLVAFAGLATYMALTDFGADIVPAEYRNAVYDYQHFGSNQMTGYRSLYSINENPGYTKTVEHHGDIQFHIFIREKAFDYYHPSFIIFAEYTGNEDVLSYGVLGSFNAPDGRQMMSRGQAGQETTDFFVVIGTSTLDSTFELSAFFYDELGIRGEWPPEDGGLGNAIVRETITVQIPIP
jgi:heme/copper-type cytochrome/quinol oxidase subunit 2